ncbi:VOC family protein [Sphingomonas sp.]|uniref:VOC family protein n=1 Tax=Sphingomonas sp. TaxID=28214 RepID=UPI003CC5F464
MANPHGTPIWYELLTPDVDGAKRFYDAAVSWTIEARPAGPMDYRMITAPDGNVGGVMALTEEMQGGGAKPGWLFYVGVDDVDATAAKVGAAGGAVLMPPWDIPNVGRVALFADPQGAPFYVMRGATDGTSTAFSPAPVDGHCSWNELWTSDAPGALAFYRTVFGWENPETMNMGPMGGYHFLHLGDTVLGALMQPEGDQPSRWNFYFSVPDLDTAIDRATAGGATITMGPHDVPGGQRIVMGEDPQGARFALVGPGKEEQP